MSIDHDLLLVLGSVRTDATNNEKITGKHELLLGLGDRENINDQLTKTHG